MALVNFREMSEARIGRGLRALDAALDAARTLPDLQRATVQAHGASRSGRTSRSCRSSRWRRDWRRWLGLRQAARVVTHSMMAQYARLAARPELADRLRGLDAWLRAYGHRGPLESDLCRPRFAELRAVLEADLRRGPAPPPREQHQPSRLRAALGRPLFLSDERRERFRDRLMRRWQRLRALILEEARRAVAAGHLDAPDDVFFLRSEDLAADPSSWRDRVAARRASWRVRRPAGPADDRLPRRDRGRVSPRRAGRRPGPRRPGASPGSAWGSRPSPARRSARRGWGACSTAACCRSAAVLVVPTLEPSWAVVFPRFAAVVAELGGELSHAAILLREAGIPSVVNAQGAFQAIAEGDRVRVDPARGEVVIEARRSPV